MQTFLGPHCWSNLAHPLHRGWNLVILHKKFKKYGSKMTNDGWFVVLNTLNLYLDQLQIKTMYPSKTYTVTLKCQQIVYTHKKTKKKEKEKRQAWVQFRLHSSCIMGQIWLTPLIKGWNMHLYPSQDRYKLLIFTHASSISLTSHLHPFQVTLFFCRHTDTFYPLANTVPPTAPFWPVIYNPPMFSDC